MSNHKAHQPEFWFRQAEELDRAAHLVWKSCEKDLIAMSALHVGAKFRYVNLGGVFWLNGGLALENLLKGIIIEQAPELVIDGRINKKLKTHNLLKLVKLADEDININDAFFLEIATECIIWAGRYPSSTDAKKTKPPIFSEADFCAYERLYSRFSPQLTPPRIVYERIA